MRPRCASLPMTCAMASSFCRLVAGCRCAKRLKHMCWGRKAALGRSSCWRPIHKTEVGDEKRVLSFEFYALAVVAMVSSSVVSVEMVPDISQHLYQSPPECL